MIITEDGRAMNSEADNEYVNRWFAKQKRIALRDPDTGEVYATVPYAEMKS